ncbi:acetyltransferase [Thalassotalea sp. ND16A]|uniref:acetyltransferase n=1 Tax=Thalassotalea sp. ND16A TaxID=1535422 RepID=UPI000519EE83|nr:acetyltransferase [Thalassotalea sp. ND16A]KGJ94238.1 hypothetical protein ND16A_1444 [Thalassotalea sp. ND16A]
MTSSLIIVGAGGHGQAVADLAESTGEYEEICFVDDCFPERNKALGKDIVAKTESLFTEELEFNAVFVAIGNNKIRKAIIERIKDSELSLVSLIHPNARLSKYAEVDDGVAVMAGAVVGTNARLKLGALVNANATVDHDCVLHEYAHIGVGVQLAGGVEVASGSWMQAGSCAGYFVKTEEGVVYPPGTTLIKDKS